MAPPYNSSFSVSVVLPASGCDIIAKVLLLSTSLEIVSLKVSDGGVNFIYKVREEIVDYDFITAVWWRRTDFFLKKI